MAIDTGHFKKLLLAKEQELQNEISRFDENARESRSADVEDPIDAVTSSEAKATALGESDIAAETLLAVRAALQRIDQGEYGTCVDCGRPIPENRLEAVPWTPYCIEDQEKHDREAREQESSMRDSSL